MNITSYLNLTKKYSSLNIINRKNPETLLCVDPSYTEYIPLHFFTNYLYMIDSSDKEKDPTLFHNKIITTSTSNSPLFNIRSRQLPQFGKNEIYLNGVGFSIREEEIVFCIMISSKYVKKIYDLFFEFLLTDSITYDKIIDPLLGLSETIVKSAFVSLSYDFILNEINNNEEELKKNIIIYKKSTFSDGYGFCAGYIDTIFRNCDVILNEDPDLIKSMCFCKIEINPFKDIDGPEKELISLL